MERRLVGDSVEHAECKGVHRVMHDRLAFNALYRCENASPQPFAKGNFIEEKRPQAAFKAGKGDRSPIPAPDLPGIFR
jgi:hypothetical protein